MKVDPRWDVVEEKPTGNSGHYESLFALGNGYLGTRGATEEAYLCRSPGTYLAGFFNEMPNEVSELPNLPDWLNVELFLGGERFNLQKGELVDYRRLLHLRDGILVRKLRWKSPHGRLSRLVFKRFVSLDNHHLSGLKVEIFPENYEGTIGIVSRLDGQVTNQGTQHFAPVEQSTFDSRGIYLLNESYEHRRHLVVQAAWHNVHGVIEAERFANAPRCIEYEVKLKAKKGIPFSLEKIVATHSSNDWEVFLSAPNKKELLEKARAESSFAANLGFEHLLQKHSSVWHKRWAKADIVVEGPDFDQLALRFAIFHLIQMASWHDHRLSVGAKGLTGEGYRGHVFWDTEIFILPFFSYVFPKTARRLLRYRHYTLPGALRKAKKSGYEGAMYPWESADTGDEVTPTVGGIDFRSQKSLPIKSGFLQQHITADIAYAIGQYLKITGDEQFLLAYGAEIILLGARFWASRVEYNEGDDCFEIKAVMGPDEYKENVDNNYYTNALVQKHLSLAASILRKIGSHPVISKWGFTVQEGQGWLRIADKMKLPRRDDLLLQHDGFMDLKEIDALKYRHTPGLLQKTYNWQEINAAQVIKQADVLMLFHLCSDHYTEKEKRLNWEFYEPKTMHDSSLSAAIHSLVASGLGYTETAYDYFQKAARIDLFNELENSSQGIHGASLGGVWQATVMGFAGIKVKDDILHCAPRLPKQWRKLRFNLEFKQSKLGFEITPHTITVTLLTPKEEVPISLHGRFVRLDGRNLSHTFTL